MSVTRRKGIEDRETYASSVGHSFTSTEDTNEEVHLGHTTSGESESATREEREVSDCGENNEESSTHRVTARGKPSGTATTTTVTEIMRI